MIIIAGDSNFRDLCLQKKDDIEKETGKKIEFELVTSNESLKALLDGLKEETKILLVGPMMNEIAIKSRGNTKSREDIVKGVVLEQNHAVNKFAQDNQDRFVVLIPPFLRMDPAWIKEKIKLFKFYMDDDVKTYSPSNVVMGNQINISEEDLKADKVHLATTGMEKLFTQTLSDIKLAISDHGKLTSWEDDDSEMIFVSSLSQSTHQTPASNRKRTRVGTEADQADEVVAKRSKEADSAILTKLNQMMEKMNEDGKKIDDKFDKVFNKVEANEAITKELKITTDKLSAEVREIKRPVDSECTMFASIKEDLDAAANLNLRDTIIVKKQKMETVLPADRKEFGKAIQKLGRDLVTEILGTDTMVKFVAPVAAKYIVKQGFEKVAPAYKIIFKDIQSATNFKDKGIEASKDENNKLYKVYFAVRQNSSTRIRLMLLWGIADYLKSDVVEAWATQNSPRPVLQTKEGGKYKTLSFIEAVQTYGDKIEEKVIKEATKIANKHFNRQAKKIFLILKD